MPATLAEGKVVVVVELKVKVVVVVVVVVMMEGAGAVLASPTLLTLPHLPHEDWASRRFSSTSSRRRYMIMIL